MTQPIDDDRKAADEFMGPRWGPQQMVDELAVLIATTRERERERCAAKVGGMVSPCTHCQAFASAGNIAAAIRALT